MEIILISICGLVVTIIVWRRDHVLRTMSDDVLIKELERRAIERSCEQKAIAEVAERVKNARDVYKQ